MQRSGTVHPEEPDSVALSRSGKEPRVREMSQPQEPTASLGEVTILVTDDDPVLRPLYAQILRGCGGEVLEARDGEECLRVAHERRPGLILLDLHMPGLDGWATVERLRDDAATAGIPVIVLTSDTSERTRRRVLEAAFDEHMVKPFTPQALLGALEERFRKVQRARRAAEGGTNGNGHPPG